MGIERCTTGGRAVLAIVLALWPAVLLAESPTTSPTTEPSATVETVADRAAVNPAEIDKILADHWVVMRLDQGQSQPIWGVPVTAEQPSTVICGCSSEYQFCLVIDGRARHGDLVADQGQVIFWSAEPGAVGRVMQFSGRDMQQSLRLAGRDDLAKPLDGFTQQQNIKRWWGLVKPLSVNIGAPMRPGIDSARKSYLMQPEVIRLRRAAPNVAALPATTAEAILAHLKAGHVSELSQLLSPEWFVEPAKRNELAQARQSVATMLISQHWTKQINDGSLRATDDPLKYWFSAGKQDFVLTLTRFDEMVYLSSIQPVNR